MGLGQDSSRQGFGVSLLRTVRGQLFCLMSACEIPLAIAEDIFIEGVGQKALALEASGLFLNCCVQCISAAANGQALKSKTEVGRNCSLGTSLTRRKALIHVLCQRMTNKNMCQII